MKFSKMTNKMLSYGIAFGITVISGIAFIIISFTMRDVYIKTLNDMTVVASSNIEDLIDIHNSEAQFIIESSTFTEYLNSYNEGKGDTSLKSQNYSYILDKTQKSSIINKITIINTSDIVLFSSDFYSMDKELNNSVYKSIAQEGVSSTKIITNEYGENVILIARPYSYMAKPAGYIFMELKFDFINDFINRYKFGETGNLFIITNDNKFIGNNFRTLPLSVYDIQKNDPIFQLYSGRFSDRREIFNTKFSNKYTNRYLVYTYNESLGAFVASSVEIKEVNKIAVSTALPMLLLLVTILILLTTYRYIIAKKILHPLNLLGRSLYLLKKGDLRARFNYNEDNEFGSLSKVFNQTISNLQNVTNDLKDRELKNKIILQNITDVIYEYDITSKLFTLPENWADLVCLEERQHSYSYTVEEFQSYFQTSDNFDLKYEIQSCYLNGKPIDFEFQIANSNCKVKWVRLTGSCLYNTFHEPTRIIGSIYDISEIKLREDELRDSAKRDVMTKLLNKGEMENIIDNSLRFATCSHYFLIIDLDHFKDVNDTYGHLIGDEVLVHTANVLRKFAEDTCYLCRFGGDEFIAYTKNEISLEQVIQLSNQIIKELNKGILASNNQLISIECCIGISQSPADGNSYLELMEKADAAIYYAKQHQRNSYFIYNENFGI